MNLDSSLFHLPICIYLGGAKLEPTGFPDCTYLRRMGRTIQYYTYIALGTKSWRTLVFLLRRGFLARAQEAYTVAGQTWFHVQLTVAGCLLGACRLHGQKAHLKPEAPKMPEAHSNTHTAPNNVPACNVRIGWVVWANRGS